MQFCFWLGLGNNSCNFKVDSKPATKPDVVEPVLSFVTDLEKKKKKITAIYYFFWDLQLLIARVLYKKCVTCIGIWVTFS